MNKNIYNYCKALYKKKKNNSYFFFFKKIISKIDVESKKERKVSPIINLKTTYVISGFEDKEEINEFVFKVNFIIKGYYEVLLLNTKIDFFIDNKKIIVVVEYNDINKPFIENIFEILSASDLDFDTKTLGLKKELIKTDSIAPYHVQIPNKSELESLVKIKNGKDTRTLT